MRLLYYCDVAVLSDIVSGEFLKTRDTCNSE